MFLTSSSANINQVQIAWKPNPKWGKFDKEVREIMGNTSIVNVGSELVPMTASLVDSLCVVIL